MPATSPAARKAPRHFPRPITVCPLYGPRPEHRAREIVGALLTALGCADEVFDTQLAVQELVTNALRHAPPAHELRIFSTALAVKIAVADGGTDHDVVAGLLARAAAGIPSLEESGRGLQVVGGLFPGACGAEPVLAGPGRPAAKQVWISVPVPSVQPGRVRHVTAARTRSSRG